MNRRTVLKKVAYVAPLVYLTLPAHASYAARGSTDRSRPAAAGKRLLPTGEGLGGSIGDGKAKGIEKGPKS